MTAVAKQATTDFDQISTEVRLRIQDQVARYSWAFDSGDLHEYLARFWEDGVLEHPKRDGSPGRFEGHAGIREFIGDFESRKSQSWGHQHQFSSMLLDRVSPTEIQLKAYCCVFRHEFHRTYWPTGSSIRMGTWHALFSQRNEEWKISLLQIRMWTDTSLGETGVELLDRPVHSPGTR